MARERCLRHFAASVEEHAWALAQRRRAVEGGAPDVALWEAMVADAAARRAKARHELMTQVIASERESAAQAAVS